MPLQPPRRMPHPIEATGNRTLDVWPLWKQPRPSSEGAQTFAGGCSRSADDGSHCDTFHCRGCLSATHLPERFQLRCSFARSGWRWLSVCLCFGLGRGLSTLLPQECASVAALPCAYPLFMSICSVSLGLCLCWASRAIDDFPSVRSERAHMSRISIGAILNVVWVGEPSSKDRFFSHSLDGSSRKMK